jgi:hypothetical protein
MRKQNVSDYGETPCIIARVWEMGVIIGVEPKPKFMIPFLSQQLKTEDEYASFLHEI